MALGVYAFHHGGAAAVGLVAVLRMLPSALLAPVLTPYAVPLRYDMGFWPDQATAQHALATADRVRTAVLSVLPSSAHP